MSLTTAGPISADAAIGSGCDAWTRCPGLAMLRHLRGAAHLQVRFLADAVPAVPRASPARSAGPWSPGPRRHPCSRRRPARAASPSSVNRMRRPKRRLMAAPPTSTGKSSLRRCSSLMISGICLEVETSSAERPMAVALHLDRLCDDGLGRHLLAQVDHVIAVVGEDGLDQVLADVVHIPVDGGQHHQCPC